MNTRYAMMAVVLGAGLFLGAACGDDEETTSTTTGSSSGGGSGVDCALVCGQLFDCGLEDDGTGSPLCAYTTADKTVYVEGANGNDGCEAQCEDLSAIALLVDPMDCSTTITNIKGASDDFAGFCDDGPSGGTGGGGGGTSSSGSGGSGGN